MGRMSTASTWPGLGVRVYDSPCLNTTLTAEVLTFLASKMNMKVDIYVRSLGVMQLHVLYM